MLEAELRKDAEELVREDLALEALFRDKGMEVTDEDIDEELAEIATATKATAEEARKKWEDMGLMAVIREGVMHRKAVGWLMENVTVVEDEPTDEADEAPASPRVRRRQPRSRPRRPTRPNAEAEAPAEPRAPRSSQHDS